MLDSEDGNRIYLSVNRWRLGKRWKSLILSYLKHDIVPVSVYPKLKKYPTEGGGSIYRFMGSGETGL